MIFRCCHTRRRRTCEKCVGGIASNSYQFAGKTRTCLSASRRSGRLSVDPTMAKAQVWVGFRLHAHELRFRRIRVVCFCVQITPAKGRRCGLYTGLHTYACSHTSDSHALMLLHIARCSASHRTIFFLIGSKEVRDGCVTEQTRFRYRRHKRSLR